MKFCISLFELEQLLSEHQLLVYEHLSPQDIQNQYFANRDDDLQAFETIHFVHAVKQKQV